MKREVIVRAGTVDSLKKAIENEGGIASGISVNESFEKYSTLDEALKDLTSTGGVFNTSRKVAAGWKVDIEKKGGRFRRDKLPGNKYHSLMDNLKEKGVGDVFQEKDNPNYRPGDLETYDE